MISKSEGTHKNNSTFLTSDTLYVDCAIVNDTSVAVNKPFWISLYVDENPVWNWSVSSLSGNAHEKWQDLSLGELSVGEHQIKVVADSLSAIEETSENDNTYTKTITVKEAGLPNLVPYKPSGWSDKLVVSNAPGAHTDTSLSSDDKLYVDWAVINKGSGDVTETFTVVLYVDGFKKKTWTRTDGLDAGKSVSVSDFALKPLAEGLHRIRIQVDGDKGVDEGSESDNQYVRVIKVMK